MKLFYFIVLIFISHSIDAQKPCPKLQIYNAVKIENGKIKTFSIDNDTIENIPEGALGYPIQEYHMDMCFWDDNKNRFLFKFNNKYCVTDSNMNIVLGMYDTIVPLILYDEVNWTMIIKDYPHIYTYSCFYQCINNHETILYTNSGELAMSNSFKGLISPYFVDRVEDLKKSHIQTFDMVKWLNRKRQLQGLIGTNGETITPNIYASIKKPVSGRPETYLLFEDTLEHYCIFSTTSNKIIFRANDLHSKIEKYDLFRFEKDGLYGVFHPSFGVMIKPKYTNIHSKSIGLFGNVYGFVLVKKNGREIEWELPTKLLMLSPL